MGKVHRIWEASVIGALHGGMFSLPLFAFGFATALSVSVFHLGNLVLPALLCLASCSLAGIIYGITLELRHGPIRLSFRLLAWTVVLLGVPAALWCGLTPIGRATAGAFLSGEPFFDYRPARFWAEAAGSPDEALRLAAVEANRTLAAKFQQDMAALRLALKDSSKTVRLAAVMALGRAGKNTRSDVPDLIAALKDGSAEVRDEVIKALGHAGGPEAIAAIPLLIEMGKRTPGLRSRITWAIRDMGEEALLDLLVLLDEEPWRPHALHALCHLSDREIDEIVLDRVFDFLADPAIASNEEFKYISLFSDASAGPNMGSRLCREVSGPDRYRRAVALAVLRSIRLPDGLPEGAIPRLIDVARRSASGFLEAEAGPQALAVLAREMPVPLSLVGLLKDANPIVRGQSALALDLRLSQGRGPIYPADALHPPLLAALGDTEPFVRVRAAATLWRDARHPQALACLKEAVLGRDADAQWFAAETLADSWQPDTAIKAVRELREAWRRGNPDRRAVAHALWKLDTDPEVLAAALEDEDEEKSAWAGCQARSLASDPERLLKLLVANVPGKEPPIKRWPGVIHALGEMGRAASPAVPLLRETLSNPDVFSRTPAAYALGRIGDPAAVPDLVRLLQDSHVRTRWIAARALGDIGPEAVAAVPALEAAIKQAAADEDGPDPWLVQSVWKITRSNDAFQAVLRQGRFTLCEASSFDVGELEMSWLIEDLSNPELRCSSLGMLSALGGKAEEALPALFGDLGWRLFTLEKTDKGNHINSTAGVIERIKPGAVVRRQLVMGCAICLLGGNCLALMSGFVHWLRNRIRAVSSRRG